MPKQLKRVLESSLDDNPFDLSGHLKAAPLLDFESPDISSGGI
jgi:hypothetical protein